MFFLPDPVVINSHLITAVLSRTSVHDLGVKVVRIILDKTG